MCIRDSLLSTLVDDRDTVRMGKAMDEMRSLNMGGTAIGTGRMPTGEGTALTIVRDFEPRLPLHDRHRGGHAPAATVHSRGGE